MFLPLADHAPVGLFLATGDGRWTYLNDCLSQITGLSMAEAAGTGWFSALHPEDWAKVAQAWGEAVEGRRDFHSQFRFVTAAGETTWIDAKASLVTAGDGTLTFIGSCTDLREQRQAEARMRLYDAIFSTSPDFAYVFGTDHRIVYANKSLLTMWGRTWEETVGKTWLELGYEPWHAEMHDQELDLVIRTKRQWRSEIPFTGVHGRRIYDYIFTPVIGETGKWRRWQVPPAM